MWNAAPMAEAMDDTSQVLPAMSLNSMSAGIAHDVNNMMQVILGNLELAAEEEPESLLGHGGGWVECRSQLGEGTDFIVYLPSRMEG